MAKLKHGEEYTFMMSVPLDELIACNGIEELNEMMDVAFEEETGDGNLSLVDIGYELQGISGFGDININVTGTIDDFNYDQHEKNSHA
jgi:hypothetical protein